LQTSDFYDRIYFDGHGKSNYSHYDIDSSPFASQADVIEKLLVHFGLDGPVLDVGCAKGYLVYVLRLRGVEAYGLDWSQYALDHSYPDARPFLQRADATRLPFTGRRFALATSFDVLEHLDHRNVRRAFLECARVSDRQLHQVNTGRLLEWAYEGDESHCVKYPLERWQAIVDRLGLDATTVCEPDQRLPFLLAAAPWGDV
jgi:SAM-dependent methyltransferase